jgi:type I restriction enzyme, S subunit
MKAGRSSTQLEAAMKNDTRELLERHFDTAFAAPDGIKKLRELILTLAMQGKLVAQDPNDPPARKLLEEIEAEKRRLVKEGKIKKPRALPEIKPVEVPYGLPHGWEWVRLDKLVSKIGSGSTPRGGKSAYVTEGIPFLRSQNVWNDGLKLSDVAFITPQIHKQMSGTVVFPKDILLNITGASIGRSALVPDNFKEANVSQHVTIIRCIDHKVRRFIHYFLLSPNCQKLIWTRQVGMAREGLSKKVLEQFEIPLPPLSEQHRIVARIDQLMARCDDLEKLRTERDQLRLSVNTATIQQLLDAEAQDSHTRAWQFLTLHFEDLYTVRENIAELRKAILQLSIMGRLVDNNNPRNEYEYRSKQVNNKHPFSIPDNWEWVSLSSISDKSRGITYGIVKMGNAPSSGGVFALRCSDVKYRAFDLSLVRRVSEEISNKYSRTILQGGELLLNIRGTLGGCAVVPKEIAGYNIAREIALIPLSKKANANYILNVVSSPYFTEATNENLRGIAYKGLNLGILSDFLIPLPPIEEQAIIISKVDQLMKLCDVLEQKVDAATGKQSELLNSVIAQV